MQDVLTVASAEFKPPQQLHQLVVDRHNVRLQARLLAHLQHMPFHLLLGLLDDFLDPRRVDPAVLNQLGQGQLGGLTADVVEGADDHDARRVVHDHVHAGGLLEGADVAALAADDPALHVVRGDVHRADRGVGGVLGGVALDRGGQDFAGLGLAGGPQHLLLLLDPAGDLVGQLLVEPFQQHLLGFRPAQVADLVQFGGLKLAQLLDLAELGFQQILALVQLLLGVLEQAFLLQLHLVLLFLRVLAFFQAAFLLAQLALGVLDFAVELLALLDDFVLGPQLGFFADVLRFLGGLGQDLGGAVLGAIEVEAILSADQFPADEGAAAQPEQAGEAAPEKDFHEGHSQRGPQHGTAAAPRRSTRPASRNACPVSRRLRTAPAARRAKGRPVAGIFRAGAWPEFGSGGAALGPAPEPSGPAIAAMGCTEPGEASWPRGHPGPGPRKATTGGS